MGKSWVFRFGTVSGQILRPLSSPFLANTPNADKFLLKGICYLYILYHTRLIILQAMLYYTTLCYAILYYILWITILYSTLLYSAILSHTVLYWNMLDNITRCKLLHQSPLFSFCRFHDFARRSLVPANFPFGWRMVIPSWEWMVVNDQLNMHTTQAT